MQEADLDLDRVKVVSTDRWYEDFRFRWENVGCFECLFSSFLTSEDEGDDEDMEEEATESNLVHDSTHSKFQGESLQLPAQFSRLSDGLRDTREAHVFAASISQCTRRVSESTCSRTAIIDTFQNTVQPHFKTADSQLGQQKV
ncbi:unnamed protein product [Polarella glacialis]|uniref:Uncharacterized protein n=1 Tax=Polarella glacialis TaxID=89957 RepID=A0A813JFP3_POLGL|nr:unnamed protein product [Polarella glacialis]CAE8675503.1 unnamed protein product [Polarella glacialis]